MGTMNIYAKNGDKVRFHNEGGYDYEQKEALKHLVLGAVYTIDFTEVHGDHTNVRLKEFPKLWFNSVQFDDAAPTESKAERGTMDMRDKCKRIEKFQQGTCCEPPQPSVQLCNDTTCGLPKCHAIHGTARGQHTFVEPSVQGEQDWIEIATKKIAQLQHMGIERGLEFRQHKIAEIIRRAAPSITSARPE